MPRRLRRMLQRRRAWYAYLARLIERWVNLRLCSSTRVRVFAGICSPSTLRQLRQQYKPRLLAHWSRRKRRRGGCFQEVVAVSSLRVQRPVSRALRVRRFSRWGSLQCGDLRRVSLANWVRRGFMLCISSSTAASFRAAKPLTYCRRGRSRAPTWLRWRSHLARGVGNWNYAVIQSRSDWRFVKDPLSRSAGGQTWQ